MCAYPFSANPLTRPTTPDCCGIGYMIYEDEVSFTVSRWGEGASVMADAVRDSMREIETILARGQ